MNSPYYQEKIMDSFSVDLIVKAALIEDLVTGPDEELNRFLKIRKLNPIRKPDLIDVTSDAIFEEEEVEASVIAKSNGILSGSIALTKVFEFVDSDLSLSFYKKDGEPFHKNEKIVSLNGRIKSILKGERTALNFLGHLSGIATEVNKLVQILEGTGITILDTRKTLPGLRELEKNAVVHGGGKNHRNGLFDMVLIKDNHIDAATGKPAIGKPAKGKPTIGLPAKGKPTGSIAAAVKKVRTIYGKRYKIEVETRSHSEVEEALLSEVDRIMLDNMKRSQIKKAVKRIDGKTEIEVSGNMNRKKIKRLGKIPVDYISAGYITYAAGHSDFSLKIV